MNIKRMCIGILMAPILIPVIIIVGGMLLIVAGLEYTIVGRKTVLDSIGKLSW